MQGMATDEAKGVGQPTGLHIILINVEREWSPCAWQHTSTMTNEQINPWLLVNASMTTDCDLMPQKLQVLVAMLVTNYGSTPFALGTVGAYHEVG